jgi:hypothetical protein
MSTISRDQRFRKEQPCPICQGYDDAPRGSDQRCYGFRSAKGTYAHCTIDRHAGRLNKNPDNNTYPHKLYGDCPCGTRHDPSVPPSSSNRTTKRKREVDTYDYTDEEGKLLYQVVRYADPKGFRQRRPDGKGGWIWNLQGTRRVLYRLQAVLGAVKEQKIIYLVEGEKDARALNYRGLMATTNSEGAGKWHPEFAKNLRGARLVILPDNDEEGRRHADKVTSSVLPVAAWVKRLELPGLPAKGDVSDWLASGHTTQELLALVEEAPIIPAEPQGDDQESDETSASDEPGDYLDPYVIRDKALYYWRDSGDGKNEQLLCNFTALITEQRIEDDGIEQRRIVTLQAELSGGKCFPSIPVSMAEFLSLTGLLHHLGTEAWVSPGPLVKDRIRHAIQLYSHRKTYPSRRVLTHLGWRHFDEGWAYLHAAGALGNPDVEVAPDEALQRYRLTEPTAPLRGAVTASLQTLQCGPERITIPLLAETYTAPLAEWQKPDFSTWIEGPSGSRKSSVAAVFMGHFGIFDRAHPPASWEDSANALEKLAFLAKDAVLWIDDFAPATTTAGLRENEAKAQRLVRAQGNLTGRRRMRADTSLRPAYHPRGLLLVTGELHPAGQSTFARILQLDVAPDDIDLQQLSIAQAQVGLLPQAMAGYLQWLQPQLETRPAHWHSQWHELRASALPTLTNHPRHPEIYAHLGVGWYTFLEFAVWAGALSAVEAEDYKKVGLEFIAIALTRQRIDAVMEDPVRRFINILVEAFAQKQVYVNNLDGQAPPRSEQWGWVKVDIANYGGTVAGKPQPAPGAELLGWIDEDFLYLLPDAAYRLAFSSLQQAGTMLIPQAALWKRLAQEGYLQHRPGRYTILKRVERNRRHVLAVSRERFLSTDSLLSGKSGDTGDNEEK